MKNKIEIYQNVNYDLLGTMYFSYIPFINTHLIINNKEYIIIDYLLTDYDSSTLKMIVRQVTDKDKVYKGKIF